ncbi:MAG: shikimate dehydrogenase [Pirellulaceae bacterium]|nr:shikimate dehydrogenase [Pirellulaceae bacterium]
MLCVTIGRTRHKYMIAEYHDLAAKGAQLVEMRLDYVGRAVDLKRLLESRPCPIVITCRRREDGGRWEKSEEERQMLLRSAIASGVDYVDLEEDIAARIPRYGKTKRIVSLHNFERTPEDLHEVHARLAALDADVVKIATLANSFSDTVRMLQLMASVKTPTIGLCMGDLGAATRILALRYGAPFTYTVLSSDRKIAPGQITWQQMRDLYRPDAITENTKLFGVVADPVAHSLSPLLHNTMFAEDKLDCRYLPFRVPAEDLELFMTWCRASQIGGLSVTIPHKEPMLNYIQQAEQAVNGIGALNTVVFREGEALGYNTDYRAAMDSIMERVGVDPTGVDTLKGRGVLILGAGGVSRAIAYGLRQRGAIVAISSRTQDRSERLARDVGARALAWSARYDIRPGIIINGTPIGMHPEVDESPYAKEKLHESMLVFDTVYNPEQTLLIKHAREVGCQVITGVDMFVRQAAYQYKLFTGLAPKPELLRKTLKAATSPVNF